ncbi:mechanosensitive ion channel [bacterium]|nr:mechanosensitive ion channel [bacterium]
MKELLNKTIFEFSDNVEIKVKSILLILLYYFVIYFFYRWLKRFVKLSVKTGRLQQSQSFAITQISKYILAVVFIALTMITLNVHPGILLALSPLLIGLGLGIQQVFNDIFSGIILLIEPSIGINDIVEVDGIVARVKEIGLRTSKIESRDGIMMIIPNHKLVSENLINWSSNQNVTRFIVKVGVAYGSDVELVKKILIECAWKHNRIKTNPAPFVRFKDFGDSSLDFELLFWSNYLFPIEDVKSDLRFMIDEEFRKHKVVIPFPQRDLHFKTDLGFQNPPKLNS